MGAMTSPVVRHDQPPSLGERAARGLVLNGLTVAVMVVVFFVNAAMAGRLNVFGIHSWNLPMIWTILTAPLLHASWAHLAGNAVPLLVLGTLTAMDGVGRWFAVMGCGLVGSGLFAFLLSPPGTVTIGASGLVFALLVYVLLRGIYARDLRQVGVAAIVFMVWGSVLWGVLPVTPGVSWQAHLGGAVAGGLAAWYPHRREAAA